jgi:hypothetical protein
MRVNAPYPDYAFAAGKSSMLVQSKVPAMHG